MEASAVTKLSYALLIKDRKLADKVSDLFINGIFSKLRNEFLIFFCSAIFSAAVNPILIEYITCETLALKAIRVGSISINNEKSFTVELLDTGIVTFSSSVPLPVFCVVPVPCTIAVPKR